MELGDLDFGSVPKRHTSSSKAAHFDINFTRFYWKEMLKCVAAVHAYKVVHSDLKPANFVLVKGHLKIIDFELLT
ncbi:hypothetical protein AJ80_01605 [Polytolypa hystricis UAMH7299]|uniref:Protein kinase domain-containing protein n=1 Tax=Polytolypa hystricis (strain UAMH7299) TaxID=1447883 RepID=A0A2B7Z095_POLH7|nr:hypothetical protein AJ80_01605 [Polytolypa hystricis UAMH7299]